MTYETMIILAAAGALVSLGCAIAGLIFIAADGEEVEEDLPPEEVRAFLLTLSGAVTCRD
jgi:hypothetical protein